MFKLRSILQVDFLNRCIYFQTQKYTGSRLSKLMHLRSNLEVYRKYTFNIDVFILKLQKYTSSRLSKLMYIFSNPEVYLKQTFNIDVFILKL